MKLKCIKKSEKGLILPADKLTLGKIYNGDIIGYGQCGEPRFITFNDDGKWESFTLNKFEPLDKD
jgi:hypothetical protein